MAGVLRFESVGNVRVVYAEFSNVGRWGLREVATELREAAFD